MIVVKKVIKFFFIVSKLTGLEYKAIHRTKVLGILWKFLNPLIFIGIYNLVFSNLYKSEYRSFIISIGILIFSGISASINSCVNWVKPNLLIFGLESYKIKILLASKIYYNFVPIFYLLPIIVVVQRVYYNNYFQISVLESLIVFCFTIILVFFTMIYTFLFTLPISIWSKKLTDLKDIISHLLRIILYLSPLLWSAKTEYELFNFIIQIVNPFYIIFETLNYIIFNNYDFSLYALITPLVICIFSYFNFFKKSKFVNKLKLLVY